ncbi:galactokinase [Allofournierella sp.]|uniref:galactokinase n=1 Tax=Allofournierella sp. TaxID=1940256 RepID=UPI003AF0A7A6
MRTIQELKQAVEAGRFDAAFTALYGCAGIPLAACRARYAALGAGFAAAFGEGERAYAFFSAPGRTELGGNHTDHQRGRVLAASVNLDVIALAAPNGTDTVRVLSEGYPMDVVELSCLEPVEGEANHSAALVRGVCARFAQLGCKVQGFDAYTVSNVLKGSGLSSSAAFEVLLGNIVNGLFGGGQDAVEIAKIGQYAENVFFKKPSGLLDQMASSVGGVVAIDFADPAAPRVRPIGLDLAAQGYALCVIDTGADHADLTGEYAAVPAEMGAVAAACGGQVLRQVPEEVFYEKLPGLRRALGDRAVLRAVHFYADDARAAAEAEALEAGDFARFLTLVKESGASSFMYLQNVACHSKPAEEQPVAAALALAEHLLGGEGAFRVHGGGFAGTIQAFVPLHRLEAFRAGMEAALGEGMCHVLAIRPVGGACLTEE